MMVRMQSQTPKGKERMIPNFSPALAKDVLAKCSETLLSWSTVADQQQRDLTGWVAALPLPSPVKSFNTEMGRAINDSVSDWFRLMAAQQEYLGQQLRKGGELLRSKSLVEAQSMIAELSASTQRLWRVSAHTAVRSGTRLMRPILEE